MSEFKYTPKSDAEIEALEMQERESRLLAEGDGRFEIISSVEKTSQSGNPMLEISFKIWDINQKSGFAKDWFPADNSSFSLKKLKSFSISAGIEDKYNSGTLNSSTITPGLTGTCVLVNKLYKGEERTAIKEYVRIDEEQRKVEPSNDLNDDIPWE